MIHIGISGKIAAGKSTLAKSLKQIAMESGYACEIIPFATGVREVAALEEYNDIERRARITNLFYSWGYDYNLSLGAAELVDAYMRQYPSEEGKKNRRLLQSIGTEVGRNNVDRDIWIRRIQLLFRRDVDFVISDDLRFDNEAMAVDVHVGIDVQATFDGYQQWNERIGKFGADYTFSAHASETALTLRPMLVLPTNFTQESVIALFEQLDHVRRLRY